MYIKNKDTYLCSFMSNSQCNSPDMWALSPVKTWFVVIWLLQWWWFAISICLCVVSVFLLNATLPGHLQRHLKLLSIFPAVCFFSSLWCATMYRSQTVIVIVFVLYLCFICVLSVFYLCCICVVSVLYLCFCLMTYLPGLVTQVVNHKVEQHRKLNSNILETHIQMFLRTA